MPYIIYLFMRLFLLYDVIPKSVSNKKNELRLFVVLPSNRETEIYGVTSKNEIL